METWKIKKNLFQINCFHYKKPYRTQTWRNPIEDTKNKIKYIISLLIKNTYFEQMVSN